MSYLHEPFTDYNNLIIIITVSSDFVTKICIKFKNILNCFLDPSIGNILRHDLDPPLLQQAAFDNLVSLSSLLVYFIL